jgi:RNA polymerase sigma-70 factor (sigma-E family)
VDSRNSARSNWAGHDRQKIFATTGNRSGGILRLGRQQLGKPAPARLMTGDPMTKHLLVADGLRLPDPRPTVDQRLANVDRLASEFDSFVRGRTPALLRAAYLLTGDQHLAEDLVQSALARTHRRWAQLHHEGNAEAYTRKTMYHLQVSWWRRPKVAESMPGDLPEPRGGYDHAEVASTRIALRRALLRLTPKQRAVLVLRFFEDHSEAETAELLNIAPGTVKSQTAKALTRLRTVAPELGEFYSREGSAR